MKGSRREQAVLNHATDMTKTAETRAVIEGMVEGLNDHRIDDNWVMVDVPHVVAQLGVDCFNGHGWEALDRGERVPPRL